MEKRFGVWIGLKEKLHQVEYEPPFFKENEIWWASIGENIGNEINGKGSLFSRPVLIIKKLSHTAFIGIPMTTRKKEGTWYSKITSGEKEAVANLSQIRMFDHRRLSNKLGEISEKETARVKEDLRILLGL